MLNNMVLMEKLKIKLLKAWLVFMNMKFQELANIQLKKKMEKEKVNKLLDHISNEDREKLKQYGEILEEEAFVSEQRAYCQGYVDCIQLLAGLGLLKKSTDMEKIISEMKSN